MDSYGVNMSYLTIYHLSKDPQLLEKLSPAVAQVCTNVYTEPVGTANHALRVALVNYASPRRSDFTRFAEEIAMLLCVLNPALDVTSTDAELVTAVTAIWNAYAAILQAKGLIAVVA